MLHVHRADRADRLVAALADMLADPLPDPLATEVIAVPSRGIERWIAQELSARLGTGRLGTDGVCANVDFPFPGRLVRDAVVAATGIAPDNDPWLPARLTWPLLELADANPTAPMLGPLAPYVGGGDAEDDDGLTRRLSSVRHVADLFDRYAVHRPTMVLRWRDGDDVGPDTSPLPDRHRWQPQLWRAVREHVATASFAERREAAIAALRDDPDLIALPPRLAMFGLTALPATYFEVITALGIHRDLQLLLLHPSRDLWDRIAGHLGDHTPAAVAGLPVRDQDPTADLSRNPLLRSWARDVRELQLVTPLPAGAELTHHELDDASSAPPTLLQRLQADVRTDRHPGSPDRPDRPALAPDDHSVQLHDCHGRLRQVEVLRDAILHLLADSDLEPRDVIVMCPDIETFAPLITAVFGAAAVEDEGAPQADDAPPALRVRLADRALRRTNPVLEVVAQLLDLVDGRVTASDVIDLIARDPVRHRFGFTEDDIATLETWVKELQVRWGLDADHREQHGLPLLDAHTWRAGLERLLLGATMADEDLRLVEGVAPYDGLEGSATDLAGRFVELIARLASSLDALTAPAPVVEWRDRIRGAADRITAANRADAWQRLQLDRVLDELVDEATLGDRASSVALTLAEVRTALADRLAGRPSWTSHRTGDLTFSTLVPMRSVPHRVVCLLGLDDQAFPRQVVRDEDDLLGLAPRVGDRDPRSEDRQLLLDALMAATETLVVTFAGRHERTNDDQPPAVPVDELRDVIDRTVAVDDDRRPRDHVTVRHPLAEHDPQNFIVGQQGERPWGFDPAMLDAARASRATPTPAVPFLSDPLPSPDGDVIELDDLVAFLQHPAKAFVRQRLELTLPAGEDEPPGDGIPSTLKALDAWKVGDPIVRGWLDGDDRHRIVEVLRARGLVPPGELATQDLDTVLANADLVIELSRRIGITPGSRSAVDVEVPLPDGRTIIGTVGNIAGSQLTTVSYSKVGPKHRLAMWAQWRALIAMHPDQHWEAATVGRHPWKKGLHAQAIRLRHRDGNPTSQRAHALDHLGRLVDLYDRGMRSPVPLYCKASAKSAQQVISRRPAHQWVDKEWETKPNDWFPNEDVDPYHLLVLGRQVPTNELLAEPCRDEEETAWADDDSDSRFVAYAWRLWEPILQIEREVWL